MNAQKIAITVPPLFLRKLDDWSKKKGKTRSRFIVEEMAIRLKNLEDEEIIKIYNEAYGDPDTVSREIQLAEEMLGISTVQDEKETW